MRGLLPHGFWIGGTHFRELELRALDDGDDAFLLETVGLPQTHRINLLVARCASLPGNDADMMTVAHSLVAGDREALLLQLHRANSGEGLTSVLHCTNVNCKAPLELNLTAGELLLPPYAHPAPTYTRALECPGGQCEVTFRLPTAGDQEEVADLAAEDAGHAARRLLQDCVSKIVFEGRELEFGALTQTSLDQLAEVMAEIDPQACIELKVKCPSCGSEYGAQLDMGDFFWRELDQRVEEVLQATHTLALAYHWSEAAILTLPPARRKRYLDLIALGSSPVTGP